jgi:hypothetical protein
MLQNGALHSFLHVIAIILLALVAAWPSRAAAWQGGMSLVIAEEDLIVDTDAEVFVVTVSAVSGHKATRARPPRVVLKIDETIRGTARKKLRTVWEYPFDPESDNADGPAPTKAQRQEMREYAREPLSNPQLGGRWLVIIDSWPDGAPPQLPIAAKFPLTAQRRRWAGEQLRLRKRYDAERRQYRETWPPALALWADQVPDGARPVTAATTLRPGTPVLVKYATTTQCYVVEVFRDGRVKIRPQGYDSRRDDVVLRDKLLLYPHARGEQPGSPSR